MDYLEGFLVGPVWSDTDYRTRRHLNAHILLAAFMAAVFVLLVLFPPYYSKLVRVDWPLSLVLLLALIVLSPFISILYRRLPFYLRPLFLVLYAGKILLLLYVLVQIFLPLVSLEKESVLVFLYDRMDGHIGTALETIAESGGILVTVAGVVVGGLWVLGEGLALLALLVLIPLLAVFLYKVVQFGLDYLVKGILDRQLAGIIVPLPPTPSLPVLDPEKLEATLPEELSLPAPAPLMGTVPTPVPDLAVEDTPPAPPPPRRIPLEDKLPREKRQAPPKARPGDLGEKIQAWSKKVALGLLAFARKAGQGVKRAWMALVGISRKGWDRIRQFFASLKENKEEGGQRPVKRQVQVREVKISQREESAPDQSSDP